jgi:hypothetical protein
MIGSYFSRRRNISNIYFAYGKKTPKSPDLGQSALTMGSTQRWVFMKGLNKKTKLKGTIGCYHLVFFKYFCRFSGSFVDKRG